jgi:bifunctional DNase/RNase
MLIPVEVSSFAVEPQKSVPLIILKETGGARSVAIPLDPVEACAIAMHSLKVPSDKPFTIDLVKIAIEQLGGELYRSVISDVEDSAFTSYIVIKAAASLKVVNCRPCDAVALAMRCGAQMFVKETVFCKLSSDRGLSEEEELRAQIRAVDAVEFGKMVLE